VPGDGSSCFGRKAAVLPPHGEPEYCRFVKCLANRLRLAVPGTLVVVCAACALAPSVALAGTLDQQQTDGPAYSDIYSSASLAQSFTAGVSGGVDQVDLYLSSPGAPTAPLSVEIRDVYAGAPGVIVLASHSVPASGFPAAFMSIKFATPAPVVAGTQYAIVAYSSTGISNPYLWFVSTANPYAGGQKFAGPSPPSLGSWSGYPTGDLAFKTYVVPPVTTSSPTGQRAAALKKCKHKHSKRKRKKCRKTANLLPA
jgi:hypothetical protein